MNEANETPGRSGSSYELDPGVWRNIDEIQRGPRSIPIPGVYAVVDHLGTPRYFGSSSSIWKRVRAHRAAMRLRKHQSPRLQALADQHGLEMLSFLLVTVELSRSQRRVIEDRCIDHFKTCGSPGGGNRMTNSSWGDEARVRDTIRKLVKSNGGLLLPSDFDLNAPLPVGLVRHAMRGKDAGFNGNQLRGSILTWFRRRRVAYR